MSYKKTFVLDIGSGKLSLLTCIKPKNKLTILTRDEIEYDGFMDGSFLNEGTLPFSLQKIVNANVKKFKKNIDKVYVGVPSEFCVCVCKRVTKKYEKTKRINSADIKNLFDGVDDFENSKEYNVLNFSAMQFVLDDGYKTISPIGKKTQTIIMDCSYVLAKKSFCRLLKSALQFCGVSDAEFLSAALGQGLMCIDKNDSLTPIAVVDVGHITTSVAIVKGEGLALLSSFSLGGGHISSDLMQLMQIPFADADAIKRKVLLTIEAEKDEKYSTCVGGKLVNAVIPITNGIVKSRIENIAGIIKNILDIDDMFENVKIYLTGNGLVHIRGAKQILSATTAREVIDYFNKFDYTKNRFNTSGTGLLTLLDNLTN